MQKVIRSYFRTKFNYLNHKLEHFRLSFTSSPITDMLFRLKIKVPSSFILCLVCFLIVTLLLLWSMITNPQEFSLTEVNQRLCFSLLTAIDKPKRSCNYLKGRDLLRVPTLKNSSSIHIEASLYKLKQRIFPLPSIYHYENACFTTYSRIYQAAKLT